MTALQLNADIYRNMAIIAEDESMLKRVANYVRKIAKQLTDDPTCMTKEEYFAMLDRSEKGPSRSFENVSDLDRYIRSL